MPTNGEANEARKGHPRRRHKPKFEVPPEIGAVPETPWVYRVDTPAEPDPRMFTEISSVASARRVERTAPEGVPDPTSIMLAALETMAISVAAANRMFLAAVSVMVAPVEVTRKILGI